LKPLKGKTAGNLPDTDIYCITDEKHSRGRDNIEVVEQMIDAGIKIIQYREKEKNMAEKYEQCLKIRKLTRDAGVFFIVNDHIDLALIVEADGIHVGQEDLPIEAVRRLVGENMVIGLSTHSPLQAKEAIERGADYIGVGPIFKTYTKKDVCDPVGFEYLDHVVQHYPEMSFVAIGGIKANNVGEVAGHGAKCISLVTEITGAENIAGKIKEIRIEIEGEQK
jgi:thiamine-phosphate pyrophosphorylase